MKKPPAVILVRPQLAENIGMCARAMANFGLSQLRLVSPRDGWPRGNPPEGAVQAAAGARRILDAAEVHADLRSAIGDLIRVYATTARPREQAKPVLCPGAAMSEAVSLEGGTGILFGPERTGLTSDEISLASAVVTFSVDPDFSSLNLAQAVLLMSYEWRRQSGAEIPFGMPQLSPRAKRETLLAFFSYAEGLLTEAGFFHPPQKRPVMIRNLRNLLHRLDPSEQDVRTLRGALRALVRPRGRGRSGSD